MPASAAWCSRGLGGAPLRVPGRPWVVIDTETSGLDPARHRLTELAAVVVSAELRVERELQWRRSQGQETLISVCKELASFAASGVVVAHRLSFDLDFLQQLGSAADAVATPQRWLCTLHANGSRRSLDVLAAAFDVSIGGRHTAIGDARALSLVLSRAIGEAEEHGMTTVAGIVVRMALRQGRPVVEAPAATGWPAVVAQLDYVVPLPVVTANQRAAVAATFEASGADDAGPGDPSTLNRVARELRDTGVSALACAWILEELGILVSDPHRRPSTS